MRSNLKGKLRFTALFISIIFVMQTFVVGSVFAADMAQTDESPESYFVCVGNDAGTMTITGYTKKEASDITSIVIPKQMYGRDVTAIDEGAFSESYYLKSITIPEKVESIGDSAFENCIALKEITIPSKVSRIGMFAFMSCINLEKATILYGVRSIGDGAFANCKNLSCVSISPSTDTIDNRTFDGSTNITVQANPDSVAGQFEGFGNSVSSHTELPPDSPSAYMYSTYENGEVIIEGYVGTSENPVIPNKINGGTVVGIGERAFENKPITQVTLPASLRTIGANAFAGTKLTVVEIPSTVTAIADGAFNDDATVTLKGDTSAIDEFLKKSEHINFIPWGQGKSKYHELKLSSEPDLGGIFKQGREREYREGYEITLEAQAKTAFNAGSADQGNYMFRRWEIKAINNNGVSEESLDSVIKDKSSPLTIITMPACDIEITAVYELIPPETLFIQGGVVLRYIGSLNDKDGVLKIEEAWRKEYNKEPETITGVGTKSCSYKGRDGKTYYFYEGPVFVDPNMKGVILPDTVTDIHSQAFISASGLEKIGIGNGSDPYNYDGAKFKTIDGVLFSKGTDGKLKLIAYPRNKRNKLEGSDDSYKVPDGVTEIGDYAFYSNKNLTSIDFNGVKTIGSYAFAHSQNITSIDFSGVETIGGYAFYNSYQLSSIDLKNVKTIGYYAFGYLTSLSGTVNIPGSVTSLGEKAFCNCINISAFTWGENTQIKSIPAYAFSHTGIREFKVPGSVTDVNSYVFSNCPELTKVNVPAATTNWDSTATYSCVKLQGIEVEEGNQKYFNSWTAGISDGVLYRIDKYEENGETKTKKVLMAYPIAKIGESYTVESKVDKIDNGAFGSAKIREINLSDVKEIGANAFAGSDIRKIDLSNITSIGSEAFYNCKNLESVIWSTTIKSIPSGVFELCDKLSTFIIPDGVTSIGNDAFNGCTSLNNIELPSSLTSIGSYAFASTSINNIEFPSLLTSIGSYAFAWCANLESAIIKENPSLNSIGEYAFENCSKLSSFAIPDRAMKINQYAFQSCTALEEITIPASVTLYNGVFYGCSGLKKATVYGASIPAKAFMNCTLLSEADIKSVGSIGDSAFSGCSGLTDIAIGEEATAGTGIGSYAFNKCINLATVKIGKEINSIGNLAFNDCESLTTLTIGNESGESNMESIGSEAFSGCHSLVEIKIPASVTSIGERAFNNCEALERIIVADDNSKYSSGKAATSGSEGANDGSENTESESVNSGSENTENASESVNSGSENTESGSEDVNSGSTESVSADDEGILFNKDRSNLIFYPQNKAGTSYTANASSISNYAFESANNLTDVVFTENVSKFGYDVFKGNTKINSIAVYNKNAEFEIIPTYDASTFFRGISDSVLENLIVHGYIGSTIETQVFIHKIKNIKFQPLDEITEGFVILKKDDGTGEIVGYNGIAGLSGEKVKNVVFPSLVTKDMNMTIVDKDDNNIVLADGENIRITSIGSNFDNAGSALTPRMGSNAVDYHKNVASVSIPYSITEIKMRAFEDCTGLTSINLPSSVEKIYAYAFKGCIGLNSIKIPKKVILLGKDKLLSEESDTIPRNSAFVGCTNLRSIEVEKGNDNYTSVDGVLMDKNGFKIIAVPNAFAGNVEGIPGKYVIPEKVETIGDSAFVGCTKLKVIEFPTTLVHVGVGAFDGALTSKGSEIIFHRNEDLKVKEMDLDNRAFADCTGLAKVVLPGMEIDRFRIGNGAFEGCTSLAEFEVEKVDGLNNEEIYVAKDGVLFGYTPAETKEDGEVLEAAHHLIIYPTGKTDTDYMVPAMDPPVREIYEDAFRYNNYIENVVLPERVSLIREGAFMNCNKLKKVTIYNNDIEMDITVPVDKTSTDTVTHTSFDTDKELTLCGYDDKDSKVKGYAEKYEKIKFEPITGAPITGELTSKAHVIKKADISNGSLIIKVGDNVVESAEAPALITVEVKPNNGYMLKADTLKYVTQSGEEKPIELNEGIYTFAMPDEDVTLTAEFILSGNSGSGGSSGSGIMPANVNGVNSQDDSGNGTSDGGGNASDQSDNVGKDEPGATS